MFTGLVQAIGEVVSVRDGDRARTLEVRSPGFGALVAEGDSVSVDGVCLTVRPLDSDRFSVDLIHTTLDRTIAGGYREGVRVNLEPALRVGDRLGGHFVQGHVDAVGTVNAVRAVGESHLLELVLPESVARYTVPRGSITVNGVSLTVSEMPGPDRCEIGIIPHTWAVTTLSGLSEGDAVNVEADWMGRYVEGLLAPYREMMGSKRDGESE